MDETRITHYIENHFYTEGIDVLPKEYNATLAGLNDVVSWYFYDFFLEHFFTYYFVHIRCELQPVKYFYRELAKQFKP